MAGCPGKKEGKNCLTSLYKCKHCGNIGCDQFLKDLCTNQGFVQGKCVKCGTYGQKEPVKL